MYQQVSKVHFSAAPGRVEPFKVGVNFAQDSLDTVMKLTGIGVSRAAYRGIADFAMDAIQQPNMTTPSLTDPLQFLQSWMNGAVVQITAARKIDDVIGYSTVGNWGDEQIVQQALELSGSPTAYADTSNTPLTDWNQNFIQRTIVRFELGMRVGRLEEYRSAQARVDSAAQKRTSCSLQLEILRNAVGFYGYNNGLNLTYGFLNDPNLPAYQTVATGSTSGSKLWSLKTFQEIKNDLLTALQQLRTQSQDTIDPGKTPITLVVATNKRDYLTQTTDFGISVMDWLKNAYPNVRIESAPQLTGANGGADVFYMFADRVADGVSTDDQMTFMQMVPAKFQMLGAMPLVKAYEESYSNATAGVMVKRPYAVTRWSGI